MRRIRNRPALAGVLLAGALGLLARLVALGARTAHLREAEVAVSVLDVIAAGRYTYVPAYHGPLLYHLEWLLFPNLGTSDATMRLGVALIGAALPLTAWLFRERLRDEEVVAAALLLAATPVVLYYSRFFAGDVPLATFGLATVGFGVRAADTGQSRYVYAAAVTLALAMASKWYALLYVGTWAVGVALLLDYRLFVSAAADGTAAEAAREWLDRAIAAGVRYGPHVALGAVAFVATSVLLFAPRPDLGNALGDPGALPGAIESGSVGAWDAMYSHWIEGRATTGHPFLDHFVAYAKTLVAGGAVATGFGALGFVVDRYTGGGQRDVVAFATYWGMAGLLLYPALGAEPGGWNAVHAVVPLAVPAGVALGAIYRHGRRSLARGRTERAALAALVLVLVVGHVAAGAYGAAYASPNESPIATTGQPSSDLKDALSPVKRISSGHEGVDVALYGTDLWTSLERPPLDWYLRSMDATYETYSTLETLPADPPPVVIAAVSAGGEPSTDAEDVAAALEGYRRIGPVELRPSTGGKDDPGRRIAIFVATDR